VEAKRVLLVTSDRNIRRRVTRALASGGVEVRWCPTREEVLTALPDAPEMCIIDADEQEAEVRWLLQLLFEKHADVIPLLVSHDHDNQLLIDLLSNENLNNVVAKHGGVATNSDLIDEAELIVTCQKLFNRDIFGLEKYLPAWGIKIYERTMTSTDEKREVIGQLEEFLDAIDCYGSIKNSVILVADELIMNAVFNAPRTPEGTPKYADTDRRERIVLEPGEHVKFRYACDGRNVLLSVGDQFGSLSRDVIVRYLKRCFSREGAEVEEKRAGAGLGLYMIFNSITQLTFNIRDGVATEAIASFYVRSRARAFRSAGRSLNIFLQKREADEA
jgi:hypothetical protein